MVSHRSRLRGGLGILLFSQPRVWSAARHGESCLVMCSRLSRYALKPCHQPAQRMAGGILRGSEVLGLIGRGCRESIAWHLERLEIGSVTLRVRMEKDESVHRFKTSFSKDRLD